MKLGILTDTHLGLVQYGLKEREQDFYDQYFVAIKAFIDAEVDIVIIGGDVFDKPRPSPKALEVFSTGLGLLFSQGIQVCNVIGNHAMIQAPGFVTADEFIGSIPRFSDNYTLLNEDINFESDVLIMGLPFHYNSEYDKMIEHIKEMNEYAGNVNKPSILVLHQSFKEFCGFDGEELSIRDIDTSNFDLIVCGHIHERKIIDLGNDTVFLQPGSLERSTVAEAKDEENNGKGIFIIDSDHLDIDSVANGFRRLGYPRKFLIADMYMNGEDDVQDIEQEILSEIQDCIEAPILFLTVHDKSNSFLTLMDLTKKMNNKCLTVNFNYFDESVQHDSILSTVDGDIPEPRKALKISLNPLDKEQAQLGLDIYDLLKDGKDATELLHNFLLKKAKEWAYEETREYYDEELQEIEHYFERI